MTITVSIITNEADFGEISPMVWDAWQQPYNPQLKHFRPKVATRAEAIAYNTERSIQRLRAGDPKMFMLKAVDSDTNVTVGFAQWYVNDKPDPYGERTVATWHPEGSEEREFAERFINGLWGFIGKRVTRPHMGERKPAVVSTLDVLIFAQIFTRLRCILNTGIGVLGGC
jgi:hypothetical protein